MMINIDNLKTRLIWGLVFLLGIVLTACAQREVKKEEAPPVVVRGEQESAMLPHAVSVNPPGGAMMLSGNTMAGDALGQMLLPRVGSGGAILAASLVDMDNFDKSSAFGRASMQQIGSRLSQHGFRVLEPRLGASLRFEKRQGEFMLTRDTMRLLMNEHDAHAALVGTYSESKDKVFVSVRVVRLGDSAILGAYEYYLPKNEDVETLLGAASHVPGGNHLWRKYATREPAFPAKK